MKTLKELTAGIKPVIGYPKVIEFGPYTLEGYMLEDGSFRQAIKSTGRAMGMISNSNIQRLVAKEAISIQEDGQQPSEAPLVNSPKPTAINTANPDPYPVIQPVRCPGVASNISYTINLPMVVEIWKQVAKGGGVNSAQALELLGLSAIHSLERTYQEAFGVSDTRSTNDRLLDWAIRLDAGSHYPLFHGAFHKHFARVTGLAIGHPISRVYLAELIYHRLPESIYETLKDLNPELENGWRQYTHSQLMTDDMRNEMRAIVMAVTNQLANTPGKAEDPKAYRQLLKRLDKTMPRYKKRGQYDRTRLALPKSETTDNAAGL